MTIETMQLTDDFSTCAQITAEDLNEIAALGFKSIINNRPDLEGGPDQPLSDTIKVAAESLGLSYTYIPVVPNNIQADEVAAFKAAFANAPKPVLGFCRTGNRAGKMFALAQA